MSPDAHNAVDPPPWPLRALLVVGALLLLAPLGYAWRYVADWRAERAGRTLIEQQLSLRGVPFYKPAFLEFLERARATIPADARLLVTPRPVIQPDGTRTWDPRGTARWFLYLNHFLHPRQVHVRRPELASGTLVDYPRWLEHHFLTLEGPDGESIAAREEAAIEALGIDWRLDYLVTQRFMIDAVVLERLTPTGWERVELAPLPPESPLARRERGPAAEADDDQDQDPERGS